MASLQLAAQDKNEAAILDLISAGERALEQAETLDQKLKIRTNGQALQFLTRKAKLSKDAQNRAAELTIRTERQLGIHLRGMEKNRGSAGTLAGKNSSGGYTLEPPEDSIPTYADYGIDKKDAMRWQTVATLPEEKFEEFVHEKLEAGNELTSGGVYAYARNATDESGQPYRHVSDESYEWYTPKEYVAAAAEVMGGIDLDPASCDEANKIVLASKFFDKAQDGLSKKWEGNIFLNPPYCMPEVETFTGKAISEHRDGNIAQAIVLVNNCTDTEWFHALLAYSGIACILNGRIKFYGPHANSAIGGARQGQVIFYIGGKRKKFAYEFAKFGIIVEVLK